MGDASLDPAMSINCQVNTVLICVARIRMFTGMVC